MYSEDLFGAFSTSFELHANVYTMWNPEPKRLPYIYVKIKNLRILNLIVTRSVQQTLIVQE